MDSLHSLLLVFSYECDTFVSRNHRSLTANVHLTGNSHSRRHHSEHFPPAVLMHFSPLQDASAAGSERSVLCKETSFCHKIWHKAFSCRNSVFDFTWNLRPQFSTRAEFIIYPERTYCDRVFLAVVRRMLDK